MYAVLFHAHQKLDRIAWRHLGQVLGEDSRHFPTIKQILHFEGQNGPDSTKFKKNENVQQPWHFINPFDPDDTALIELILDHHKELINSLRKADMTRSAFEAAWLAHAIVDGLTPAHHYPYEKELEDLRGEDRTSRTTLTSRVVVKGDTARDSMKRSLRIIGPKGLLMTHTMFEAGAYSVIAPLRLNSALPSEDDITEALDLGIDTYFLRLAKEVAAMGLYESFYVSGWTPKLARQIRRELAPRMVSAITLSWYKALAEAGLLVAKK